MKKTGINPGKLSKIFKVKYKESYDYVLTEESSKVKTYVFKLGDDREYKTASLYFHEDRLDEVNLTVELKNEYRSSINFTHITKIVYIPKYRAVRFESHTSRHYSILKIYWRGQFDLFSNLLGKNYKETVWVKRKDY